MPPVFEGEKRGGWVGGAEFPANIRLVGSRIMGKEGGYLAGFCLVIPEFCFAEIANVN